ncbi:hypothetical protein [Paenibacillus sp. HGF7]|nr:hypothetical protein [Paenibacillus sp. HGF7]EGL19826.1 hypothetical protein HMPREF9413_4819 [Paenibacillus sp. HGF7]
MSDLKETKGKVRIEGYIVGFDPCDEKLIEKALQNKAPVNHLEVLV